MKRSLSHWHAATLALLFVGYAGYYFCRTNLTLAKGDIAAQFGGIGITEARIALIGTIALWVYAVGKLFTGAACDFLGGRRMFILGAFGSVACTLMFVSGPTAGIYLGTYVIFPVFLVSFSLNRWIQSAGWAALVKLSAGWFSYGAYGRAMGVLCMSYLIGDFAARQVLPRVRGGWEAMFLTAAGILAAAGILNWLFLRSRPSDVGIEDPPVNPANYFGPLGLEERPANLWELFRPYLVNPSFWIVVLMSITLSFVRESLNWANDKYIALSADVEKVDAQIYSSYFPLFGAVAVFVTGFLTDRLFAGRRGLLMAGCLGLLLPILSVMAFVPSIQGTSWPIVLTAAVGFLSLAPYAFLSGVISLDLGGKRGSSTAAGIVDSVGYALGSAPGLYLIGHIVVENNPSEWRVILSIMIVLVAVSLVASLVYWHLQERRP